MPTPSDLNSFSEYVDYHFYVPNTSDISDQIITEYLDLIKCWKFGEQALGSRLIDHFKMLCFCLISNYLWFSCNRQKGWYP